MKSVKSVFSVIIVCAFILAVLTSCSLIRKADENADGGNSYLPDIETAAESETYSTGFSESLSADSEEIPAVVYSEDEAFSRLAESFEQLGKAGAKIEKTGNIIAENDSAEYYIFNVSFPQESAEGAEDAEPAYGDPVKYYVSKNGVIHDSLTTSNVDTLTAKASYTAKYGENDEKTGYPYELVYDGIVNENNTCCYCFKVYLNAGGDGQTYKTSYFVTLDGKQSAVRADN